MVVGESPGQNGGVSFHVDQRESCAADGAAVGVCAVVNKYTGVAEGIMEGGPYIKHCKGYRKEIFNMHIKKNISTFIPVRSFGKSHRIPRMLAERAAVREPVALR